MFCRHHVILALCECVSLSSRQPEHCHESAKKNHSTLVNELTNIKDFLSEMQSIYYDSSYNHFYMFLWV